jgi:2'-5' RNA ligase
VGRYLQEHGLFASPEFVIDRFVLYSSVLGRKGASHTVEQEYLLQD